MGEGEPGEQTTNPPANAGVVTGTRAEPTLARVITFIVALVLPLISFPIGADFGPDWQNGSVTQRAGLHLDPEVTIFFAPFIIIAWVAVLVTIAAEQIMSKRRITRLMVYSGIPVSLQYVAITSTAFIGIPIIIGAVVVALWTGFFALHRRTAGRYNKRLAKVIGGLWLGTILLSGLANTFELAGFLFPIAIPLFLIWLGGPAIAFVIAVHRSIRVYRAGAALQISTASVEATLTSAGLVAWLVGYALAWREGAAKAIELYEELPVDAPTCYVATAAANGHRSVVRSESVTAHDGSSFAVTTQLQTLKLAEIVFAAQTPRVHAATRRVYDRLGPVAAARLHTRTRADIAYLALKPVEAIGAIVVLLFVSNARATRTRIYRSQ